MSNFKNKIQHKITLETKDTFKESVFCNDVETEKQSGQSVFNVQLINTPLGQMVTVADDAGLHLLEFCERKNLIDEVQKFRNSYNAKFVFEDNVIIEKIRDELSRYFSGNLIVFNTPLIIFGTPFQERVWRALIEIPYGQTRSYGGLAKEIKQITAVRAVARANGANQLAIVIPCHRVIGSDGKLTGYAGGIERKQWLLEHEATHSNSRLF